MTASFMTSHVWANAIGSFTPHVSRDLRLATAKRLDLGEKSLFFLSAFISGLSSIKALLSRAQCLQDTQSFPKHPEKIKTDH